MGWAGLRRANLGLIGSLDFDLMSKAEEFDMPPPALLIKRPRNGYFAHIKDQGCLKHTLQTCFHLTMCEFPQKCTYPEVTKSGEVLNYWIKGRNKEMRKTLVEGDRQRRGDFAYCLVPFGVLIDDEALDVIKIMAGESTNSDFQLPRLETIEAAWETAEKRRKIGGLDLSLFEEHEKLLNLLSQQEDLLAVKLTQLKANCTVLKETLAYELPKRRYDDLERNDLSWQWRITMVEGIPNPICKGKYFDLQVCLKPVGDSAFPIDTRVPVSIALLTSSDPALLIPDNMAGGPIVRGQTRAMLKYDSEFHLHTAKFRLQVTEVSSHFINGWVKLVVLPETESEDIASLVINNVVVRAKERTCRKFLERQRKGRKQHRVRNFACPGNL